MTKPSRKRTPQRKVILSNPQRIGSRKAGENETRETEGIGEIGGVGVVGDSDSDSKKNDEAVRDKVVE